MIPGSTFDTPSQRTLAAIVFTDVVNYSARMNVDEEHTLELVQRDLQLIADLCETCRGQVLKFTGDGLLMHFQSAVDAVGCAQNAQKAIAKQAKRVPEQDVLWHRIGIHLGDVFLSKTDVMGDGVNIAARLQSVAQPGGICMSRTVYDVVKRCLTLQVTDLGPTELKNIREAVHVYQILMAAIEQEDALAGSMDAESSVVATVESIPVVRGESEPETTQVAASDSRDRMLAALISVIGPIGSLVFSQALKGTTTNREAVDRMMLSVPADKQDRFLAVATELLELSATQQDTWQELELLPLSEPDVSSGDAPLAHLSEQSELEDDRHRDLPNESSSVRYDSSASAATGSLLSASPELPSPSLSQPHEGVGLGSRTTAELTGIGELLTEAQIDRLTQALAEELGPMAGVTLERSIAASRSLEDVTHHLLEWLPGDRHADFQRFCADLFAHADIPETHASSSRETNAAKDGSETGSMARTNSHDLGSERNDELDPQFIQLCQLELAKQIGPIATIAIAQSKEATDNRADFLARLASYITDERAIETFKEALQSFVHS